MVNGDDDIDLSSDVLLDGRVLCRIANAIAPGSAEVIHKDKSKNVRAIEYCMNHTTTRSCVRERIFNVIEERDLAGSRLVSARSDSFGRGKTLIESSVVCHPSFVVLLCRGPKTQLLPLLRVGRGPSLSRHRTSAHRIYVELQCYSLRQVASGMDLFLSRWGFCLQCQKQRGSPF